MVGMLVQHQFAGIFDSDEALIGRDLQNQGFRAGGLAAPGGSGDKNVLPGADSEFEEGGVVMGFEQVVKFGVGVVYRTFTMASRVGEEALPFQLIECPDLIGRASLTV